MSRTLWFVAGAASGVYTLYKAKQAARNLTPDGIGARVAALSVGARMFADEVTVAMAHRESELRAELGRSAGPHPAIESAAPPVLERQGADDGHR
jgi:hypothetical protein